MATGDDHPTQAGREMSEADRLAEMLSEGLDLCVRARKLDAVLETLPVGHPKNDRKHQIIQPRSATPAVWALDQYDQDLEAWERRARKLMVDLGYG